LKENKKYKTDVIIAINMPPTNFTRLYLLI